MALVDAVGGGVIGVALSPTGLGLLAPRLLARRLTAGSLACADSRVRKEPLPADSARFLPGVGHARPWSRRWVGQFWRAVVGRSSRAPKEAGRIAATVKVGGHGESCFGSGSAGKVENLLIRVQRLTSPVEREC